MKIFEVRIEDGGTYGGWVANAVTGRKVAAVEGCETRIEAIRILREAFKKWN